MTSKSDSTNSSAIAVRLQIINHDPMIHSFKGTTAAADASTPAEIDLNADNGQCNSKKLPHHYYHKTKRKRDYRHDDNATIYISQDDLNVVNTASSSVAAADATASDNGDNKRDKMQKLFDGMTCRLSKTAITTGSSSLQSFDDPAENDRSVPVGHDVGNVITDPLWAPVILRVLNPSILNKMNIETYPEEKTTGSNNNTSMIPTIFISPCIGATIGIHWFHRNNTTMMMAYLQPLQRTCIVTGSSATIREIGRLSSLLMMDDSFYNWDDVDNDDVNDNVKSSERTNYSDNNKDHGRSKQSSSDTRRSEDDEEKQLRQFFLSKRCNNKEQQNPSYQSNYTCSSNNSNDIIWKPRQRLLTVGSIFATPVITTYCDCYNRIFHRGNCKEYITNIRYYQVVDVTSAQSNVVGDDEGDDTEMIIHSEDRNRARRGEDELAHIVSPMTHLTLQPPQQHKDKFHEIGYTRRLPRPSFTLSYLQSVHSDNGSSSSSSTKEMLAFGCVSNLMSISKPNTIYHPSAKSLSDVIYLQGIIVGGSMMTNNMAFRPNNIAPRIVHVIGESENNVRGCIDEAADMMGMRTLHVGGLAAFLAYYNSKQTHDNTRTIFTGGLADKLKGLAVALDIANQSSPCVLHIESLDHELTPTTGQMADASGRDEEERRILQVIRDKTVSSSECFETTSPVSIGHDLFSTSYATPQVIIVFSTSNSLPPGPISSSLQQPSVTIDPPDRKYAEALWSDDVDGTFEPLSMSLLGLSAMDISYLRQRFVQKWNIHRGNDLASNDDSGIHEVTPMSVLEPLLKDLETIRSFTQRSRNSGGGGGSNTLPLSTSSLPNVRWEDIGGIEHIRKEIMDAVELPLKYPQFFVGSRRSGILLFGPPGTGKTLVAKAVARECGLPFLSIKGPELLGSYVGESEANIRAVFDAARSAAQHSGGGCGSGGYSGASVLFFDELDSLAPRRGETGFGDGVMDRVVSTLLGELDGGEMKSSTTKGSAESHVIVIGATNRPDLLDPSLLRPGRFDRLLYLGPAKTKETMFQILKAQTRKFKFEPGCDADTILRKAMESFPPTLSGADLSAVASKALMRGLKRVCDRVEKETESLNLTRDPSELEITVDDVMESWSKEKLEPHMCVEDFVDVAKTIVPSISSQDLENFEKLQRQFASR